MADPPRPAGVARPAVPKGNARGPISGLRPPSDGRPDPLGPGRRPLGADAFCRHRRRLAQPAASSDRTSAAAALAPASIRPLLAFRANSMINSDAPKHTRLRLLVSKAFTARAVDAMTDKIQRLVDGFLDAVQPHGRMDVDRRIGLSAAGHRHRRDARRAAGRPRPIQALVRRDGPARRRRRQPGRPDAGHYQPDRDGVPGVDGLFRRGRGRAAGSATQRPAQRAGPGRGGRRPPQRGGACTPTPCCCWWPATKQPRT